MLWLMVTDTVTARNDGALVFRFGNVMEVEG